MKFVSRFLAVPLTLVLLLGVLGCQTASTGPQPDQQQITTTQEQHQAGAVLAKVTVSEDFEAGTKTAYASADVAFTSGTWTLNDALVGTSSSDPKNGAKSVRVRISGTVTMKFNRTDGAGVVSVKHAKYGTDASSTWSLWYSVNSGSTWTQTGSAVTTSSTTLQTASFTVNVAGTVRFQIRKTDGTGSRINFDDFIINDYSTTPPPSSSEHLVMGNPSGAAANTAYPANYLMEKVQYALSYNRDRGIPNWTAWHLDNTWLGSVDRTDDFRNDTSLPSGWYQVQATSYSGSGYDRGHMCPSADRTNTTANNSATFLMTNMIPQAPNNNQGPWANLENYCRSLVTAGKELYIYSGGYGTVKTINSGHVAVPTRTWKVIMVLDNGSNDLGRVTASTRVIAVDMPNDNSLISKSADWKTFRVTTDNVESKTGYDFFPAVSTTIQAAIESKVDTQ